MGAVNQMMGSMALMREDLLMCLYCNLAGMALWFPMLFRMKFRFTNKTLLTAAATGVLACNLIAPHITYQPLLWAVCFISGICKIQGTFECFSNIQLWITPKRDFTVFFPLLHIIVLGCVQVSDMLCVWFIHHYHWHYMHLFICSLMLADLMFFRTCLRHFRFMKRLPLYGIDWLGGILWASFVVQLVYLFTFGDWYDWLNSPVIQRLAITIPLTLGVCIWRMNTIRHPFLEPQMWKSRRLFPILGIITIVEGLFATEHVLEETFFAEVMHYAETVSVQFNSWVLGGIIAGCMFSYWWMHLRHFNYMKLVLVGLVAMLGYILGFYFTINSHIHMSHLYLPLVCRGFAHGTLSPVILMALKESMSFQHFFQSLGVYQTLHLTIGGVIGSAAYTQGLSYYMPDNFARYGHLLEKTIYSRTPFPLGTYLEQFSTQMLEISIKQIYGWTAYVCLLFFLILLLYDAPVRRNMKRIPNWKNIGIQMRNSLNRFNR